MSQRFTYHIRPSATPFAQTHTFSAKEKDAETGLSVTSLRSVSSFSLSQIRTSLVWHSLMRRFGSRYYSSDMSIWLSIDPMSDKYPSLSPYVYCADNPVKLVDPNGMEIGGEPKKKKHNDTPPSIKYIGFFVRHPSAAINIGKVTHNSSNISTVANRFATRGEILSGSKKIKMTGEAKMEHLDTLCGKLLSPQCMEKV